MVGMLWDVTDRDIDRFGESLLTNWLEAKEPAADPSLGVFIACGFPAQGVLVVSLLHTYLEMVLPRIWR